ncbi:MAG: lysylphosphatidylglycerol synthase transmembrane domain-containing protein [bacterium]|nr:lysylphosphatidylglycerol synthase transmembrane domain-containing protein [bacterium]
MFRSRFFKIFIAILAFSLLFYMVDLEELKSSLFKLTPENIFYLMMLSVLLLYLSALKWSYFLEAFSGPVSVLKLFNLYMLGYFVNLIAPSYIGGDAARSYFIGKKVGQHQAFAATILERYTGLVAMLSLGVVFVWIVDLVTWPIRIAVIVAALGLVVATIIALSEYSLTMLSKIKPLLPVIKHLKKIQDALKLAKGNKTLLLKALIVSFTYHFFTVINVLIAAAVIGWNDPSIVELFVVLPLIFLVSALPLTPNSLGLQEGAYYYFLTGIGATPTQALSIGIVLRAKTYVLAIWGGIVWLLMADKKGLSQASSELNASQNGQQP